MHARIIILALALVCAHPLSGAGLSALARAQSAEPAPMNAPAEATPAPANEPTPGESPAPAEPAQAPANETIPGEEPVPTEPAPPPGNNQEPTEEPAPNGSAQGPAENLDEAPKLMPARPAVPSTPPSDQSTLDPGQAPDTEVQSSLPPAQAGGPPGELAAAPEPAPGVQDEPQVATPEASSEPENAEFFAYLERIDDFVRLSDRDQLSFGNVYEPTTLEGDYNILTPRTGGTVIRLPGGARIKMDPDAEAAWFNEEFVLKRGFFEIEAPTLFYVSYAIQQPDRHKDLRGAARFGSVSRSLDSCQQFLQATQKSHFQVLLRPGSEIVVEVIEGDVRQGRDLMLPPRTEVAEGIGADLVAPEPMIPFGGHTFYRPLDEMAFVVHSDPGRAWIFEFSHEENFAEVFCRVTSPKNSIRLAPFNKGGHYFWRVSRVNPEGIRTFFSEPLDFELH